MKLNLGKEFKTARKNLGLSQKQVCQRINISTSYYSDLENDVKIPTLQTFLLISKELKINPNIFEDYSFHKSNLNSDLAHLLTDEMEGLTEEQYKFICNTIVSMVKNFKEINDSKNIKTE